MEIKDRILKKAEDLFFVYGIKSVSMNELATSLGISKRTIYENFKDKEDILTSLMIKLRDDRNLAFQEYLSDDYNVVEVFLKVIEIQSQMPECNAKFFQDIYKYYPKVAALIHKNMEENNIFLQEFLQKGINQGYIREDLNIKIAAFLVEESTHTYLRASYIEKPPFSFNELFKTMMINFVRGISTEKGIKIIDAYLEKEKSN
jgi:AcrR family transcriptional regulator